ncbi:MAG TPA: SDR family oxidoreductase [Dermatophilaceae bacterium]|nr:SDR family oxidoreductase [Dermatophilaceae bacterium]
MPTALITGATQGLGRALAEALAARGWRLVITARSRRALDATAHELGSLTAVIPIAGDVTDADHRRQLVGAIHTLGELDLLVNNASTLGPTPLRRLRQLGASDLQEILAVDVVAPHALTHALLPVLERAGGAVVNISSDASVEHYETWGGYGAAKAALDHLSLTLAGEQPTIRVYAVDPGDMRTAMHQSAFPGEDIGDRPLPAEVAVPGILALLDAQAPSGRYRAAEAAERGRPEAGATATTAVPAVSVDDEAAR